MDQLGLREARSVEAASLAKRPTLNFAGGDICRVRIVWLAGCAQAEGDLAAVGPPLNVVKHADGEFGRCNFFSRLNVEDVQYADAVFVRLKRNPAAIF